MLETGGCCRVALLKDPWRGLALEEFLKPSKPPDKIPFLERGLGNCGPLYRDPDNTGLANEKVALLFVEVEGCR